MGNLFIRGFNQTLPCTEFYLKDDDNAMEPRDASAFALLITFDTGCMATYIRPGLCAAQLNMTGDFHCQDGKLDKRLSISTAEENKS